jgi:hypothetical protein
MSKHSSRRRSSRSRADRPPTVVKAMGPADLLRFVPELLAVDYSDSLVLILFRRSQGTRSRTQGAMRIDLPHALEGEELDRWAAAALGQVLRAERITGVAAVAYTPETFAPDGRPPAAAVLRAVGRQAERMGLEVLDRFCVAADGWGSLDDPELPRGGRPLAEIEPAATVPPRVPRTAPEVPLAPAAARRRFQADYSRWWLHADGPGRTLHGVALMRPGTALGVAPDGEPAMERYRWGRDVAQVVDLVEGMLEPHDDEGDSGPCPCRALLLALAERQGLENLVLLQLAWGRALGQEMWTAVNAPTGRRRSLDRLVAAIGGGRFRRPDPDRIERAIAVLQETAAYVPVANRAPLDGMLAWLLWARGGSSAAGSYALRALERHPGRDVPSLVLAKVQRGELPEWAFSRDGVRRDPYAALLEEAPAAAG